MKKTIKRTLRVIRNFLADRNGKLNLTACIGSIILGTFLSTLCLFVTIEYCFTWGMCLAGLFGVAAVVFATVRLWQTY